MTKRTLLAVAAAAVLNACAGPGGPSPTGRLAYGVPTPPTAVYDIVDSMTIGVNTPVGNMEVAAAVAMSLDLAFASDPGGVRVTGAATSFEASMNNPMTGTETAGLDDVTGELDFVMDSRGRSTVASMPAVTGAAAQLSPFASIAHDFFPRLPDRVVEPGESWVDTVSWSTNVDGAETNATTVYTYTLARDTVVDGGSLLWITVVGEVQSEAEMVQAGMNVTQSMTGSTEGYVLWDREGGRPVYIEADRDFGGVTSMPGMGSFDMTVAGPVRVRLQRSGAP